MFTWGESLGFFKAVGESSLGSYEAVVSDKGFPLSRDGGSSSEDSGSESGSRDFSSDSEGQNAFEDRKDAWPREVEGNEGDLTTLKVVGKDSGQFLKDKLKEGSFTTAEALEVLRNCAGNLQAPHRKIMSGKGRYVVLGLYNQGGFNGVTSYARKNGDLVRYLNGFVAHQGLDYPYTTLYLSHNASVPMHRDSKNDHSVPVWIIALGDFLGGGLWI